MNLGRGILGELDGMATLTFCGGDPVNCIDPTGLEIHYVPDLQLVPGTYLYAPSGWGPYAYGDKWHEEFLAGAWNMGSLVGNTCGKMLETGNALDDLSKWATGMSLDTLEMEAQRITPWFKWDDILIGVPLMLSKVDDVARGSIRLVDKAEDAISSLRIRKSSVDSQVTSSSAHPSCGPRRDLLTSPSGIDEGLASKNNGFYPVQTKRGVRWKDAQTGKFVKTPEKGLTILGHDSYKGARGYVQAAQENNANFFRMSDSTYSKWIREGGRKKVWESNLLYLEEAWKRGDEFGLATELFVPGSFADELKWLQRKGVDIDTLKRF